MSERSGALRWGHVNVNVSDLARSVAFYERLGFRQAIPGIPYLGLRSDVTAPVHAASAEALELPAGARGRACILELDDGFPKLDLTELATQGAAPLRNTDTGIVRICLGTADLARDYERLRSAGVSFLTPPVRCDRRMADIAVCRDPDGTLIELIELHLERWSLSSEAEREG